MHELYLGLGSNLGNREENIRRAIAMIGERLGSVVRTSSLHDTEPMGFESANRFLNAACCVLTTCSPQQCLEETLCIEKLLGRTKKSTDGNYCDRTIDIDLLIYDDLQLDTDVMIDGMPTRLTLPHPRMHERDFVMKPLHEIYQNK